MGMQIGTLYVRRSALIRATAERVWQEFTTFDRFSAWFGQGHRLETYQPVPGGRVRLSVEIDGVRTAFGGSIVIFAPARELTFTNNWESDDAWPVPTALTLRLAPLFDACQVELFHHGFERLGDAADEILQGYESGWHSRHLEALKRIVEARST